MTTTPSSLLLNDDYNILMDTYKESLVNKIFREVPEMCYKLPWQFSHLEKIGYWEGKYFFTEWPGISSPWILQSRPLVWCLQSNITYCLVVSSVQYILSSGASSPVPTVHNSKIICFSSSLYSSISPPLSSLLYLFSCSPPRCHLVPVTYIND